MYFKLYEYDGTFKGLRTIPITDIMDYTFTERDFPEYDELEMRLIYAPKYVELVPKTIVDNKKPLLLTKEKEDKVIWFSFIVSREVQESQNDKVIYIKGTSFSFFNNTKLIASNKNYPNADKDNLPADFALYQRTTNLANHLNYFFDTTWINPKALTYGDIATVPLVDRKFKGLSEIVVNYTGTETKAISVEQTSVTEAMAKAYELFGIILQQKQEFDRVAGTFKFILQESNILSIDVVRRNNDIIESFFGTVISTNYVFGYGNPSNATNQYSLASTDFTTIEKSEDFSFVSGDNLTYLENTARTSLANEVKERLQNFIKVKPTTAFIEFRVGDIALVNGKSFKIKQIKETNSINGIDFDLEIKEV